MKITNEVKVGLLAIIAIIVLVIGFNFLKGSSTFSKPFTLYAHFPNIGALEKSNDVKINGLTVGKVYNYKAADKEVNSIIVELRINDGIAIPKSSIAFIDGSVLGSPYINIQKGASGEYLKTGDSISTKIEMGLLGGLQAQVAPTITRLNETFDSLKLVIGGLNSLFDPNTKSNLRGLISNLTLSSAQLAQLLNAQSGALAQSLGNMNAITANLAKNNDAITSSIRNVEVTTSKLANMNIDGLVSSMQATVKSLQATVEKFGNNNGTLGLLINDRGLYDKLEGNTTRLNQGLLSLEILLDDIRLHPKRYLNISVFGGKKAAEPITSPAAKDTVRVKY